MYYIENDLMDETIKRYYDSCALTLDTGDFVTEKSNDLIIKMLDKTLKKQLKRAEIYSLIILKDKGVKLNIIDRFRVLISGLEKVYKIEKAEKLANISKQRQVVKDKGKDK